MIKCDLLIVTSPYTDTKFPLQAPAVIKSSVESKGFTARTFDLNHRFLTGEDKDPVMFDVLKNYFAFGTVKDKQQIQAAKDYVNKEIETLLGKFAPDFIAISVFTYQCKVFAEMMAERLRKVEPQIKIIFGGQGLTTSGINASNDWVKNLKAKGTIDHYIISEGENAMVDLLSKGRGPGIDKTDWRQITNLDHSPFPDYSDYDLDSYAGDRLMITGSRGCVRRCSFCDIHKHWQKFVFRSGDSIASEMMAQSKRYNKYKFGFTDSLVNGSMKAYRDFINRMAKHNANTSKPITWSGQFIVRGIKSMSAEDWRLTKLAGAETLICGVESGSESVRDHMKKQFSNDDLDQFVEQAYLQDVKLHFLMIIGYPTETKKDFIDTLRMFKRFKKYQSIITEVTLGSTLGVLPGTPLADDYSHKLELHGGENFWTYADNKELTFRERIKRRFIAGEEVQKMGYRVNRNEGHLKLLHFLWGVYKNKQKQGVVDLNSSNIEDQKYS